jgi:hypothetical protein
VGSPLFTAHTDTTTIAEVKAALDQAMQIEIEAEKPGRYLWKGLIVVIPCFLLFFLEIIFRRLNRSIRNKKIVFYLK